MSLRNSVSYALGTMDAANEYTPMIFVKDFQKVIVTVIAAWSANATVKFYASDSEVRPNLWVAASATNIYSPVEILNIDTLAAIDGSTGISWAGATDGITRYEINCTWSVWVGAIMTASAAGDVSITLQAFDNQ